MRYFETRGPVNAEDNYVVARLQETADFMRRVGLGRYIVLFAPRQTGKTTFFKTAVARLETEGAGAYLPIQLNFEIYEDWHGSESEFYGVFYQRLCQELANVFRERQPPPGPAALTAFLENTAITDRFSLLAFFEDLGRLLGNQPVVLIIDEFDAIPPPAVKGFLRTLRHIYISGKPRCPHSVVIVGVKNITQLNYDRTISPFNIQDEFHLPNFTLAQVQELLGEYTAEVGQAFAPAVIETLHRQTGGQPFLVNRLAQILTEEMDIPKTETIHLGHFSRGHAQILHEQNVNIRHLTTNIRRNPRFQRQLMQIISYDEGVDFNFDDDILSELATYGVIAKDEKGICEIANPIYLYRILRTFQPFINGLEQDYYPQDTGNGYHDYLTADGTIAMGRLLDNFRDFIARAGFRILQVPETPREYVGQYLLFAYLDQFVRQVRGAMHLEVQTGRGRADLVIFHHGQKHIVETKIWQGEKSYRAGKAQLSAYLKLEGVPAGYYVVFDHRETPVPRVETETVDGRTIRSYVIPVVQERPSILTTEDTS